MTRGWIRTTSSGWRPTRETPDAVPAAQRVGAAGPSSSAGAGYDRNRDLHLYEPGPVPERLGQQPADPRRCALTAGARNQGLHPTGCELRSAYLDFEYEWRDDDVLPWRAEYQIRVEGLLDAGDALFELQDHWRLDTDMYAPSRRQGYEAQSNPSKEPHPLFHFQRGGHAQSAFAASGFLPGSPCTIRGEWKGLLQTPGPRVPVLPLDPILAIDFCLSQNDGLIWRRLQNVPEYLMIVEDAQKRVWKPFFAALQDFAFRRRWFGPSLLV